MAKLSGCVFISTSSKSERNELIVRKDKEVTAFEEVPEMFEGQVNYKELSSKSTVLYMVSVVVNLFGK